MAVDVGLGGTSSSPIGTDVALIGCGKADSAPCFVEGSLVDACLTFNFPGEIAVIYWGKLIASFFFVGERGAKSAVPGPSEAWSASSFGEDARPFCVAVCD